MVYLAPGTCKQKSSKSPGMGQQRDDKKREEKRAHQLVGEPSPRLFRFPSLDLDHQLPPRRPSTLQRLEGGKELSHRPSTVLERSIQFLHGIRMQAHQIHNCRSTTRFTIQGFIQISQTSRGIVDESTHSPDVILPLTHFLMRTARTSLTSIFPCSVSVRSFPV